MGLSLLSSAKPAADPLRQALVAALAEEGNAREAVARQKGAVDRLRAAILEAKKTLAAREADVSKAAEADAEAMALAATNDEAAPVSRVRAARQAVVDARDQMDAATAALKQLRLDLPDWEAASRESAIAVEVALSGIIAPHARRLLDRANELKRELAPIRHSLLILFHASAESRSSDLLAFERGRKPLADLLDAICRIDMWDGSGKEQGGVWQEARARLRADPCAALPDFAAPTPNAA